MVRALGGGGEVRSGEESRAHHPVMPVASLAMPSLGVFGTVPVLDKTAGDVKDRSLAEAGRSRIAWAGAYMPVLAQIRDRFAKIEKPLAGVRIGACLHVTTETANLMLALKAGGAEIALCAQQPALDAGRRRRSALRTTSIPTFAIKGEDNETYYKHIEAVIATKPQMSMDDGCDLVTTIYTKHNALLADMIGGCEETTTGVIRLHAMEKDGVLPYPVVAVNDALTKHMFDNRYGTGQSTLDGVIRATNVLIAGRTARGRRLRLVRPRRRLARQGPGRARRRHRNRSAQGDRSGDGRLQVMTMSDAAKLGDVFVTVTGNYHVIRKEHFEADEGRRDRLQLGPLQRRARPRRRSRTLAKGKTQPRNFVEPYELHDGRKVRVLGRRPPDQPRGRRRPPGRGDGYVVRQPSDGGGATSRRTTRRWRRKSIRVPDEIDEEVASLKLAAMGIEIDTLTPEQVKYMASWSEGT